MAARKSYLLDVGFVGAHLLLDNDAGTKVHVGTAERKFGSDPHRNHRFQQLVVRRNACHVERQKRTEMSKHIGHEAQRQRELALGGHENLKAALIVPNLRNRSELLAERRCVDRRDQRFAWCFGESLRCFRCNGFDVRCSRQLRNAKEKFVLKQLQNQGGSAETVVDQSDGAPHRGTKSDCTKIDALL